MTPHEDLENRLRRVLDQRAQQLQAHPPTWQPPQQPRHDPSRRGQRRARALFGRVGFGGVVAVFSSIVVITIAVGSITLLSHAPRAAHSTTGGMTERQLEAEYGVLRRPQTAADRAANAGPPLGLNASGRSGTAQGVNGHTVGRVHVTIIPNPTHYTDIPSLTRVVARDGVKVELYVVLATPNPAAHPTGQERYLADRVKGYLLLARAAGARSRPNLVAPALSAVSAGLNSSLTGPGDASFAVVPDGVARVQWSWPRAFNSGTLTYQPALTVEATASENVVIATAARSLPPLTATWYAADGHVISRLQNPDGGADNGYSTYDGSTPGPETPLSRRAERDPSTTNPVVIAPNPVSIGMPEGSQARIPPSIQFFFHVLLNHRDYFVRVTGGPHPGCITPNPSYPRDAGYAAILTPGDEPTVRGDTYQDIIPIGARTGVVTCPGTYRLSVSVLNSHNQPYPPFGSATAIIR